MKAASRRVLHIQEAKTHLSRHVEAAADGEEIIITKNGNPMAKLVPFRAEHPPLTLGRLAGAVPDEAADCGETDAELAAAMTETPLTIAAASNRVAEEPTR